VSDWTVTPLHVGTLHRKRRNFLYLAGGDEPIDVPVLIFLLERDGQRLLVDSGCCDPASTKQHQPFERPAEQHPLAVLRARGIEPDSIDAVITTHLHWDHASGNHLFPKSELFAQRTELEYARHPIQWHAESYEIHNPAREHDWALDRYTAVEDEAVIAPGISVLLTPGHTPGIQAVLVETASGLVVLPGDNVPTYENWTGKPPEWSHIAATNHYDLGAYEKSFQRLAETGGRIVPSHDFRVLEVEGNA
jgi:N-acyl homoserine lactone hydrolase